MDLSRSESDWLRSVLPFFCGPSSGHGGCLLGLAALAAPPYHTFRGEHVGPSTPLRGGWSSYLGAGPKQGAKQSIDHARSPHHKSLKIRASMGGATPFFFCSFRATMPNPSQVNKPQFLLLAFFLLLQMLTHRSPVQSLGTHSFKGWGSVMGTSLTTPFVGLN